MDNDVDSSIITESDGQIAKGVDVPDGNGTSWIAEECGGLILE